ncbi:MAG: 4-(cytidine 5'-diphospho)-2-C-methyl-D-erythritol kinase [Sphingobacteriaceae bacterium]
MICFPSAKINIGLQVVSRRADGYHNLESVFYPIGLKEALEVVESDELSFTSSGLSIPGDVDSNLCLKAYRLLAVDFSLPPVHIHLHKHIPIGAGLGGGSADAAFFLHLMNDKFALGLSVEQLETYAVALGADCPFFIQNKPAFASGIGNQLRPISVDLSTYFLVLITPNVHISTAEAYRGVKPAMPTFSLLESIQKPVSEWKKFIVNDFEKHLFEAYPQLRALKSSLYEAGALYASMTGSGSSVYGIFEAPVALPHLEKEAQVFYGL